MASFIHADSFSNPCATLHARILGLLKGNSPQPFHTLHVAQSFSQVLPSAGERRALWLSMDLPKSDKE